MFEVEIKSLLGDEGAANALREKLTSLSLLGAKLKSMHKQLNHYFEGGDVKKLYKLVEPYLNGEAKEKLKRIVEKGKGISVRTREAEGEALLVLKASIDDTTSANGISRAEFENKVGDKNLSELDQMLLNSGCSYQAKWSREREEYEAGKNTSITIDKNAGYGYLAEFEKLVSKKSLVDKAKEELKSLMEKLELEELPQDRLERMFAYYNDHWPEYYGTDKIFVIE